jgi:transposase
MASRSGETRQLQNNVGTRIQALCLLEFGVHWSQIVEITGVSKASIYRLRATAIARGYKPEEDKRLLIEYVEDAPKSGRPIKATEDVKAEVVKVISKNSTTRSLTTQAIANILASSNINISARTVWNILSSLGYGYFKPTTKPGLTLLAKDVRYKWCKEHEDWTLEDWKNVIWSDETSVTMGGQRGKLRVWRLNSEAYNYHCVRRRWKGFKQFMFWGCFSYDKKGPCHIWADETVTEKKEADKWLEEQNKILEPEARANWEIETAMRRVRITRNMPGTKPTWRWNKANGKLTRDSSGGIDWYRYQKIILNDKLLPFAKECQKDRPKTIVQEDNASPHAHIYQHRVYSRWEISRMLWPPNSPDLNMIEPLWFWMKKETTKYGAATSQKQLELDWLECWENLSQERIRRWIERIPVHIKKIIALEGGNEYREGSDKKRQRNPDRVH